MSITLNDTIGIARNAVELAKTSGLFRTLRGLDLDNGLAWFGLSRSRSALRDLAVFSAGFAVGAGAGLLFAPVAGADARRAIVDQLNGLKKVERDVEHKVADGAEALKDKVDAAADAMKDKVDAVAEVMTDKAEAAAEAMDKRAGMRSRLYPRDGHRVS
jgi:gas vesicle protein